MIGSRLFTVFLVLAACTATEEEQPPPTPPEAFLPEATGDCPGFVDGDGCSPGGFSLYCTFSPAGIEPRLVRIWFDPSRESAEALVFFWHGQDDQAYAALTHLGQATIDAIVGAGGIVAAPERDPVTSADAPFDQPWLANLGQSEPADDFLVMDEVVACAIESLGLDPRRIHSTGASSGGGQTAQVGLRRSGYVASIAIFSGFRVGIPMVQDPDNAYPVLLAHGGAADHTPAFHFAADGRRSPGVEVLPGPPVRNGAIFLRGATPRGGARLLRGPRPRLLWARLRATAGLVLPGVGDLAHAE
jgi:predicted esterase